jgi:hypothetical protein
MQGKEEGLVGFKTVHRSAAFSKSPLGGGSGEGVYFELVWYFYAHCLLRYFASLKQFKYILSQGVEGSFNLLVLLGTDLQEVQALLLCKNSSLLSADLPLRLEIDLVAQQDDLHGSIAICLHFLEPLLEVLEGFSSE